MALASYSDLKSAIPDWMEDRQDLTTYADQFISACEDDINSSGLRSASQLSVATITLDANSQGPLPADYVEYRSVVALTTPRLALDEVTPAYRDDFYPYREADAPQVFTIDGSTIMVMPASSASIEMEYYAKIPALNSSNTTNWLFSKRPYVYLYGSLKHAAVFIRDMDSAKTFGDLFSAHLQGLIDGEKGGLWPRGVAKIRGATP